MMGASLLRTSDSSFRALGKPTHRAKGSSRRDLLWGSTCVGFPCCLPRSCMGGFREGCTDGEVILAPCSGGPESKPAARAEGAWYQAFGRWKSAQ